MSDKRKYRSISEILNYLKGTLSGQERYDLEREIESDPFTREAMEGFEQFSREDLEGDMMALQSRLSGRIRRRRRITIYSAAAAVASLLIVSTIFVKLHDFRPEEASKKVTEETFHVTEPVTDPETEISELAERARESGQNETGGAAKSRGLGKSPEGNKENTEASQDEKKTADNDTRKKGVESVKTEIQGPGPVQDESVDVALVGAMEKISEEQDPEIEIAVDQEEAFEITVYEAEEVAKEDRIMEEPQTAMSREFKSPKTAVRRSYAKTEDSEQFEIREDQLRSISGKVISSEDSTPIPGATVIIKGTAQGAVTDIDGAFNIAYSGDTGATLIASFVGMESREIKVQDDSEITLSMDSDPNTLSEVVVIGYGSSDGAYHLTGATTAQDESSPSPVGGHSAFKTYIEENISFPGDQESPDRVVVVLTFSVRDNGHIDGIEVLRTGGPDFSEEAKRLLLEGPAWEPAIRNGKKIDEKVRLRIIFQR